MLRAMSLEFPEDPATFYLDQQYMLGGALLVAPIFNDAGNVRYYVPAGTWLDWFTGERVQGGTWREERGIGFDRIPLFVRPNTLLALGTRSDRPDYDFTRELELQICGNRGRRDARMHRPLASQAPAACVSRVLAKVPARSCAQKA